MMLRLCIRFLQSAGVRRFGDVARLERADISKIPEIPPKEVYPKGFDCIFFIKACWRGH